MKRRHRVNERARAQTLAERERVYLHRMLENLDAWWPTYARKNPRAEKAEVARRLAALIDKRPMRGFSKGGAGGPPSKPVRGAAGKPYLEPSRSHRDAGPWTSEFFRGGETGILSGRESGVILADQFKWYDVEAKGRSDTQVPHVVSPLGAPGWQGAQGANFWAGFARLDSFLNDINPFDGSPADRVVHMAVLRVTVPQPKVDAHAVFRTSLFVFLPHGAEVLNEWGWLDDEDAASIQVDLCSAVHHGGYADFPPPEAFAFTSAMNYGSSNHDERWAEVELVHTANIRKSSSPQVYLGIRLTLEGADCRLQTGFNQGVPDAYFGFRHPTASGPPGLHYSYSPDISLSPD